MKSGKNNQDLDAIGRHLISAASLREGEIDSLVANEDLFAGVMKRVAQTERPTVRKFSWRMGMAYASVSLTVAVVAAITAATLMRTAGVPQSVAAIQVPASQPDTAVPRPSSPPQDLTEVSTKTTAGRADEPRMMMADNRVSSAPARRVVTQQRPIVQTASADDSGFYPVSYTGGDSLAGGRIVRVDLPRAQAFAMGLHVPLENDSDTVKADMVIGADGVPRAVRLVR